MNAPESDLRQSDRWAGFMERLGWHSEVLGNNCRILYKPLPLLGSIIKVLRPATLPWTELEAAARKHRALFTKIEPDRNAPPPESFAAHGFSPDSWPLTPTKIIQVDLQPGLEELWRKFAKDARTSIKKAEHNGVVAEITPLGTGPAARRPIGEFYKIFKSTGHQKGFWIPPAREVAAKAEAFGGDAYLIIAYFGREAISGALVLYHGRTAYYEHAAATVLGRKLLAQYLVMWTLIKMAKSRGCARLDLGGIADPRYKISRRWESLGVFKAKFCGQIVTYPGSFTKYYNPLIKFLFKFNV